MSSLCVPVFIIEHQSEWKLKPHYMNGGVPGDLKGLKSFWDPVRARALCTVVSSRLASSADAET